MKLFSTLKPALLLGRSLKRIADALDEQNYIRRVELLERYNLVIPDPKKKWTRQERASEVVYGEQPTEEEEQLINDFTDV